MAKEGTLLIVDDNRSILAALRLLLEKYFARVLTLPTPNRLATTLREEQIDVKVTDSLTYYKLSLEVRNRSNYPYQNLPLSICYTTADSIPYLHTSGAGKPSRRHC